MSAVARVCASSSSSQSSCSSSLMPMTMTTLGIDILLGHVVKEGDGGGAGLFALALAGGEKVVELSLEAFLIVQGWRRLGVRAHVVPRLVAPGGLQRAHVWDSALCLLDGVHAAVPRRVDIQLFQARAAFPRLGSGFRSRRRRRPASHVPHRRRQGDAPRTARPNARRSV
eukprot:scaffold50473_cov59-Attheya_sp.AAC.8